MHPNFAVALRIAISCVALALNTPASAADEFKVLIERTGLSENALTGTISVNGKVIGPTMENEDLKIEPGIYRGVMRYQSSKNFVQGVGGEMGHSGDFLLEVSRVPPNRTDILLHGGSKPQHSKGCILLGAVTKTSEGKPVISAEHPLYVLRELFYGTPEPISSPNKDIVVEVVDRVDRETPKNQKNMPGAWKDSKGRTLTFRENGQGEFSEWKGNKTFSWTVNKSTLSMSNPARKWSGVMSINGNQFGNGKITYVKQ